MREGDTVTRLGGDEFVVMLEDLSERDMEAAAQTEAIGEKILASLNQPYQLGKHECLNSPSIGATLFNDHQQSYRRTAEAGLTASNVGQADVNNGSCPDVQLPNAIIRASLKRVW